jgi:PAS domain-containing protein
VHGHVPAGHVAPADPLSSVTDAVYRIDRRWRFTYVNAAAQRLLGRRADEMIGRYAFECFPETLGTVIEDEYRAVLLDGRVREFEYFYRRWTAGSRSAPSPTPAVSPPSSATSTTSAAPNSGASPSCGS